MFCKFTELLTNLRRTCFTRKSKLRTNPNQNIILMKQDRVSGAVLIDKHEYTENFLTLLNTNRLIKLRNDSLKKIMKAKYSKFYGK